MEDVKNLSDLKKLLSESNYSSKTIREIFKWYNFSDEKKNSFQELEPQSEFSQNP